MGKIKTKVRLSTITAFSFRGFCKMTLKIFDLQNYVDLSHEESQTIHGGSKLSLWLKKHLGIPETPIVPIPTPPPPTDPTGIPGNP